jgi:hypothetical protein
LKTVPKNKVASVLARLRNIAAERSLSFNDVLQTYCNERFLARLAKSSTSDTVLLKGAQMLRVWGVSHARPTMDIDLLRRGEADQASLIQLVKEWVATQVSDDGVEFIPSSITAESIRDETEYVGTRIRLDARLDKVRQKVQIDFGVGDAVHPAPTKIAYPVLLDQELIQLNAYPVEASIAEKFHAMVHLDMRNSRMKDFYDIWVLSQTLPFRGETLSRAIRETFERRETTIPKETPTAFTERFSSDASHVRQWAAFAKPIAGDEAAADFSVVAKAIAQFLQPAIDAAAQSAELRFHWHPGGPWRGDS